MKSSNKILIFTIVIFSVIISSCSNNYGSRNKSLDFSFIKLDGASNEFEINDSFIIYDDSTFYYDLGLLSYDGDINNMQSISSISINLNAKSNGNENTLISYEVDTDGSNTKISLLKPLDLSSIRGTLDSEQIIYSENDYFEVVINYVIDYKSYTQKIILNPIVIADIK